VPRRACKSAKWLRYKKLRLYTVEDQPAIVDLGDTIENHRRALFQMSMGCPQQSVTAGKSSMGAEARAKKILITPPRLDEWLYLVLVALLPIMQPFNGTFLGHFVYVADFVFVAAASAWLIAVAARRAEIRRSWFYLPLALYFGALIASALTSVDPRLSGIKLVGEAYLIGLAVLTFNLVSSLPCMRRAAKAWLAGTAITVMASMVGIGLYSAGVRDHGINWALAGYGSLPPGNYPRIRGLFLNMNMACNYLCVSFYLALIARSLGWLDPLRFRLLAIGIWISSVFTFSPGLGGLSLGTGLWIWLSHRGTDRRRTGQVALVIGIVSALLFLVATAISPISRGQSGLFLPVLGRWIQPSPRLLCWQTALDTFMRHPILGLGVGTDVSSADYLAASGVMQHLTDAHNIWLSVAGQEGIVGLAALIGIVLFLGKGLKSSHGVWATDAVIRVGLAIAFVDAFLYQGLAGSYEDTRHLWVLMGLLAAANAGLGDGRSSRVAP
jgi:O-antigen ligase